VYIKQKNDLKVKDFGGGRGNAECRRWKGKDEREKGKTVQYFSPEKRVRIRNSKLLCFVWHFPPSVSQPLKFVVVYEPPASLLDEFEIAHGISHRLGFPAGHTCPVLRGPTGY
jgi:hypothetical protein